MSRPFLTRSPTASELTELQKFLASFREGSGNLREPDGTTRADYRQIERCFAELLDGKSTENKSFYDFVTLANEGGGIAARGASIKSKELENLNSYPSLRDSLRSYLELSNSAAKDWALCHSRGLDEAMFRSSLRADEFGAAILDRQRIERETSQVTCIASIQGSNKTFVESDSVFISLLYSPMVNGERSYLISSFHAVLPSPESWQFKGRRLVGLDADGNPLYEWYGLSGGQLKYYPKISSRLHGTELFDLAAYRPVFQTLRAKIHNMFPR